MQNPARLCVTVEHTCAPCAVWQRSGGLEGHPRSSELQQQRRRFACVSSNVSCCIDYGAMIHAYRYIEDPQKRRYVINATGASVPGETATSSNLSQPPSLHLCRANCTHFATSWSRYSLMPPSVTHLAGYDRALQAHLTPTNSNRYARYCRTLASCSSCSSIAANTYSSVSSKLTLG